MKKTFTILNVILIAVALTNTVLYRFVGGLLMKGIASTSFAVIGIVNLFYVNRMGCEKPGFPKWMTAALVMSVAADVVLNVEFLVGVVLFALAHVGYVAAYCTLEGFQKRDLLPMAAVGAVSLLVLNAPMFQITDPVWKVLVTVYALIISCMLGKAVSNALREKTRVRWMLLAGSLLFWFSDLMLAWELFAGGGRFADTLCLFTYWPGQTVLAHSLFHYAKSE